MEKFYVTTPIYYVNDKPHIGHAYTTVAADVLARYWRQRGAQVFFLTGTDEHGQKVAQAAELNHLDPKAHADIMVENFRALLGAINATPDAFIRTTDAGHKQAVQALLTTLWERGEIERRRYSGWYCTPCERFWTEKDLKDGNCPDCGRPVEQIEEENYFFLMSRYKDALVNHIETHPGFILPETRRNEVLGFLRSQALGDLCISRPVKRMSWGIPLPFDEHFVTYVWFDALTNYYAGTRYLAPEGTDFWPATHHIIGKDILTTHAVYWTTMLMAAGLPLPKNIFAHGWWTVEGRKMSKSIGNVVDPFDIINQLNDYVGQGNGSDAFRFFLMREVPFGHDGDFSEDAIIKRINIDLANDLGNLGSRVHRMLANFFGSVVPEPAEREEEMASIADAIPDAVERHLRVLEFHRALDEIWKLVSFTNKYIDTNAPWVLAKDPAKEGRLRTVMYSSVEALRVLSIALEPFMPVAMSQLKKAFNFSPVADKWGGLKPGTMTGEFQTLFPRIETKPAQSKPVAGKNVNKKEIDNMEPQDQAAAIPIVTPEATAIPAAEPVAELIGMEDFAKVVLKTGKVLSAERVPKSNKLIRMIVDTGEERQVVAGIGKAYTPEDLVGKTVVVVTNLKPAKLMGVESQGMLLAATDDSGVPVILSPIADVKPGARIK